ncbi:hypothetical protein L1049_020523 [Liquidambar formosana]|uniref:F-box domain-containing protein n=1 Tax=Liquidambar formosana TaxID=63359 RepID=A0AAP0SE36_LIQFO
MERQDLLIEILSRLSVKDLCKFKCVSKEWYNLISDPIFRSTHHERAKRDPLMLFHRNYRRQRDYRKIPSLRLTTLDEKRRTIQNYFTTIIKDVKKMHCSAVVQAVTKVYPSGFDLVSVVNGTDDICICNPSTREFKKILPAFKPSSHPFKAFAFGYLPSSNEYKMVHFFFP